MQSRLRERTISLIFKIHGLTSEPARYPPHDPNDLVNVPIMTSTSAGSTPVCSHAPRPVRPSAPMLCASSRYKYACDEEHGFHRLCLKPQFQGGQGRNR